MVERGLEIVFLGARCFEPCRFLRRDTALESDERDSVEEEDEAFTRQITDQDFFA